LVLVKLAPHCLDAKAQHRSIDEGGLFFLSLLKSIVLDIGETANLSA